MKYIDVRLRIPLTKMGILIESLPDWAAMVGYDKLEATEAPKRRTKPHGPNGGEYRPSDGSAAQAVMRLLNRGSSFRRFEIIEKLHGTQKEKAVSSAIHGLANKGLIKKHADGAYGKA